VPVLTLDVGGPDEMDLDCERGGHAAPRKVGDRGYSGSGSEWSQIRGELMVVPFVAAPLPWSQIATIRDLFALGARVNCAGDIFNKPGTIVCSGTITDELHETGDRGTVNGTLFEVGAFGAYTPATTQSSCSRASTRPTRAIRPSSSRRRTARIRATRRRTPICSTARRSRRRSSTRRRRISRS
jgi:hypothetical protein